MNNKNFFVLLPLLALVVLAVGVRPAFAQVSVGGTVNVGGDTTTPPTPTPTPTPTPAPTPAVIHHDHDHRFFGHHGFLGLGLGLNAGGITTVTGAPTTTVVRPDFDRFHNFAFAHHDHFLFLNNRYVLLPGQVACPAGTELNAVTGECVVVAQTIVQQEAPTILQEQIQAPASIVTTEAAPAAAAAATETTQTQTMQPIVSCPAGATLDPNTNTCSTTVTVQQQQQQNVAPIITCPTGSSLQGGQCIEQEQQITVDPLPCPQCPPGSGLVNGQCVVSALPSQVTTGSTSGQIIVLGHTFEHHGFLPFLHFRH